MRFNPFRRSNLSLPSQPTLDEDHMPTVDKIDLSHEDPEALDVIADMLYRTCWPLGWVPIQQIDPEKWTEEVILGTSIRAENGTMRSCPKDHEGLADFEDGIAGLNARVALKMSGKAVEYTMKNLIHADPTLYELYIDANTRIQILEGMDQLKTARKSQYAAFIRDEAILVVWADSVEALVPSAKLLEQSLISLIWSSKKRSSPSAPATPGFSSPSLGTSYFGASTPGFQGLESTIVSTSNSVQEKEKDLGDVEKAQIPSNIRPVALITPVVGGLAAGLLVVVIGLGINSLLIRFMYDGDYSRWALVTILAPSAFLAAFPCLVLVSSLFYLFGPISHFTRNAWSYSAIPPKRDNVQDLLPITVQMPVYKESLEEVIVPTIESLKIAITTFERQGGTVNVIVCDDGLQNLSEADRFARIQYYVENDIAYVARPPHGVDGFNRRGKFKKAGNLNYTNKLSLEIEVEMDSRRNENENRWTAADERGLYAEAMAEVLSKREGKTWTAGNVRIGEVILLIDSDTRVPADCFMDASLEMQESPEVAIIQHESGVMQVAHHFFENGMAFFTRLLQVGIAMTVAGGDVAPFVGHNAFLRWSALQEVAFLDPYDNEMRVWSEDHVSEDFQVALSLQCKGWVTRWATYSNSDFQEGVSLTCEDELSRWQKYAWGCSEIVFNPFRQWFTKGPITKLFRTFLRSPIPTHSKFSIMAYIFSYYAISSAWIGSIISFVLIGVFAWNDTFYVTSWETFFICVLLFQGLNNVAISVLRYRLKLPGCGKTAIQQFLWMPYFSLFFSGLSLPVAMSLISHLVGINMSWTSTSKSVERSNFFLQLPKIFKRFWFQLLISILVLGGVIVSTTSFIPIEYRVKNDITAILPICMVYGCHLIWPFILDPYLTTFTY